MTTIIPAAVTASPSFCFLCASTLASFHSPSFKLSTIPHATVVPIRIGQATAVAMFGGNKILAEIPYKWIWPIHGIHAQMNILICRDTGDRNQSGLQVSQTSIILNEELSRLTPSSTLKQKEMYCIGTTTNSIYHTFRLWNQTCQDCISFRMLFDKILQSVRNEGIRIFSAIVALHLWFHSSQKKAEPKAIRVWLIHLCGKTQITRMNLHF